MSVEVLVTVNSSNIRSPAKIVDAMNTVLFGRINLIDDLGIAGFDAEIIEFFTSRLTGIKSDKPPADNIRQPSNTDAALCAFIITEVLCNVFDHDGSSSSSIPRYFMKGHGLGKAPLVYQLKNDKYAFLPIQIATINGEQIGGIELVLPLQTLKPFCGKEQIVPDDDSQKNWRDHMQSIVTETPILLTSNLQKMTLPVGKVLSLKLGDCLDISSGSLEEITLTAQSARGEMGIFCGRLGSLKSNKAICISRVFHAKD